MMHNPIPFTCVLPQPVPALDPRKRPNRVSRRRRVHGKQHVMDKVVGRISPAELRDWDGGKA